MNVSPTLRQLVADLGSVRTRYQAVESGWTAAERDFDDAGNELRWARFPLQRAERDNERTDVSWEGREIDRHFRGTGREIDSGNHDLRSASMDLDQIDRSVRDAQQRLQAVIGGLEPGGPALGHLRQAAQHLDAAKSGFAASSDDTDRALRDAQSVERELQFSQHLVQDIMFDRPGRDVSSSAWRLSSRRDTMEWNLSGAERDVRSARADGADGDRAASQAVDALNRAMAELPQPLQ